MPGNPLDGIRLAFSTLTVLPLRPGRVDRSAAAVAMAVAPVVGALLGGVLAGVLVLLGRSPTAAAVTIAVAALLTRGLHLDGLADTVDALGSYRRGAAGLEIMKRPDIGPFGVAAITLVLLVQAAAVAATSPWALPVAWATGRLGITLACRRGVAAARPDGLGAMVAGTVAAPVVAVTAVLLAAAGFAAAGWRGPVAVLLALAVATLVVRHTVRRFGGITGDVLGAVAEITTTVALVVLAWHGAG